jgi:hypothetical protein
MYKVDVNPSTPRPEGRSLPFDKLKAPSTAEGLRVDPERRFFLHLKRRGLPSTRAQAEGAPPNGSRGKDLMVIRYW